MQDSPHSHPSSKGSCLRKPQQPARGGDHRDAQDGKVRATMGGVCFLQSRQWCGEGDTLGIFSLSQQKVRSKITAIQDRTDFRIKKNRGGKDLKCFPFLVV